MRVYSSFSKLAVLLCLTIGALTANAQSTTSLRGTVTDPSGGVIADAAVSLTSAENGSSRRIITDANGEYSFLQAEPGTYKLTIHKTGFATMTRRDIKLLVNTHDTLNLKMAICATGEVATVTANDLEVTHTELIWG